jgi:hypothetical protein
LAVAWPPCLGVMPATNGLRGVGSGNRCLSIMSG